MEKSVGQWMIEPLRKYAQFRGRACRSEFWWFYLFTMLVSAAAVAVDTILGLDRGDRSGPINNLVSLALIVPTIATGARRLHDTNRSGWWQVGALLGFLPVLAGVFLGGTTPLAIACFVAAGLIFFGMIVLLLVWLCTRGTDGPNRFGNDPLGREDIAEVFS